MPKQRRKPTKRRDINGCHLKRGQQSMTPGQPVLATHVPETVAPTHRHPTLAPLTLSALEDALKLNNINFSYSFDGQYDCTVTAKALSRVINPYDGADVLQFFKDAINHIPLAR